MQITTVSDTVPLRQKPDASSPAVEFPKGYPFSVQPNDSLVNVTAVDQVWSKVTVDRGGGKGPTGYLRSTYIVTTPLPSADVSYEDFLRYCVSACIYYEVDVAYLMAVARVETGGDWNDSQSLIPASVMEAHDSGPIGPFQFLASTWQTTIAQIDPKFGYGMQDITNPQAQALCAADIANDGIDAHLSKFNGLPSPAQLYLYHFLGTSGAQGVLSNPGQTVDAVLSAAAIQNNPTLLGQPGAPNTGDQLLDIVANRLHDAYQRNAPLFDNPPAWWPLPQASTGSAPWLDTAKQEEQAGVTEAPGSQTNPRISQYLESVGFPPNQSDDTPWCAAFVCWCLKNCGDATAAAAASSVKNSSYAKSWMDLPVQLPEAKVGAIAIKASQSSDITGHVGFVSAVNDDGSIILLAGNQGGKANNGLDSVCEIKFDRVDFLGFRWVG
ncbi:TIGR02594 family protein [Rhizobium sp. P44RR-XXIV]|uniref:TIGR02594 family protein n=1 Tax=Rhizobium sp. P44RR-XXIV TaxID=1921145 RepID=UPI0009870197|nr:TIGR02594 family protein [Rhizobium sp. P44RR-XXIV]TIX90509.1 TIGR02594 family protein [Rhizobium sp. P44RR-XXIV]